MNYVMTNYLKSAVYVVVVQAFIYTTCAPIPVHYGFVGEGIANDTVISLNSGNQSLTCQVNVSHYPSKTTSSYVQMSFQNNSHDTIFFIRPITLNSNNVVTSTEVNRFFTAKTLLPPHTALRIYSSGNPDFKGNIREFVTKLEKDSVQIVLNYSLGRLDTLVRTFTLKPLLRH